MAETLLIRLAAGARGFRDWVLVDEQGRGKGPVQTGIPDTGIINAVRRVVVLVPGTEVSLAEARVPGRNRQRLLRAIPYVLEEQLATDVEELHFALGPVGEDDQYPVAVVERSIMDAWAALLREQGIQAEQLIPDTLSLPSGDGWSLMVDGETVLVRSGDYTGFAVDTNNLAVLFALLQAKQQAPDTARVFGSTVLDLETVDVEFIDEKIQPLELLARGWAQGPGLNLLQGAYSRREEWGRLLRPWASSAALLLAGVILVGVTAGLNYFHLSGQREQLSAEIEDVFRKAFPQAKRIVNPRVQMEQKLAQLRRQAGGGNTDFLAMFAETADVVRSTKGIDVRGASYRNGRLDLDLQADNLQILDGLKQSLVSSGLMSAEIQSASTGADRKVKSRMRVQVKGS
ncbi:MAG: type II secretion system protein GspL [Thiogranum sp.]